MSSASGVPDALLDLGAENEVPVAPVEGMDYSVGATAGGGQDSKTPSTASSKLADGASKFFSSLASTWTAAGTTAGQQDAADGTPSAPPPKPKIAMEAMLREIAKEEADRRMAKFLKEMASVKKERDTYKEQLALVESEYVKERQRVLDLEEEVRGITQAKDKLVLERQDSREQHEAIQSAILQSQASQHEEVLEQTFRQLEEKEREVARLTGEMDVMRKEWVERTVVAALQQELDAAHAQLKTANEDFEVLLQTSTREKGAFVRRIATLESEHGVHPESASPPVEDAVVLGEGASPEAGLDSDIRAPLLKQIALLEAEVAQIKGANETLVSEHQRCSQKILAHESAKATIAENDAAVSAQRHEEILKVALNTASEQSEATNAMEKKLRAAEVALERTKADLERVKQDMAKMEEGTIGLLESAVRAERTSQETSRKEAMDDLKKEWEQSKSEEFESSLAFWQKKWAHEKETAVQNAVAKTQETTRSRAAQEKKAAIELATLEVETRLAREHDRAMATLEQERIAKTVAAAATLSAVESENAQLESKLEDVIQELADVQAAKAQLKTEIAEAQAALAQLKEDMERNKVRWATLDRAKDDEFEEEVRRITADLKAQAKEAVEHAVASTLERVKKELDDPADEQWSPVVDDHPAPPLTLTSPVIRHVLDNWTDDAERLRFMNAWLAHVCNGWPVDNKDGKFQQGLELARLSPEVAEGFEKMILPLLRRRRDIRVDVMVRTQRSLWKDMRIKVTPAMEANLASTNSRMVRAPQKKAPTPQQKSSPPQRKASAPHFAPPRKKAPMPPRQ